MSRAKLLPQTFLDRAKGKPKLTEADIQETCSQWLTLDGWRRIRTDMKQLRGMGVQEPGMADDLYLRYCGPIREQTFAGSWGGSRVATNILWIEWKCKKGKASSNQLDWHHAERGRGAITLIADIDFVASIEGFQDWYRKSGLARNRR